jgi:hypothetical protein
VSISANGLKNVGMKWVQADTRTEANQGLKAHVAVFRELGMTDAEIIKLVKQGVKKKLDSVVQEALIEAEVKKE